MPVQTLTLRDIMNHNHQGDLYGKARNTDDAGVSRTEEWQTLLDIRYERLPNEKNKYSLRFRLNNSYGHIHIEVDEEIDFVQQIGNPNKEYKIVTIFYKR